MQTREQITPIYQTSHGLIPYLTPLMKQTLFPFTHLSISLSDFIHIPQSLLTNESFSLVKYLALPEECQLYFSVFRWDFLLENGTNSVETAKGKTDKGIEEFKSQEIIPWGKQLGPIWRWEPMCECLSLGGKKREKRAIAKNLTFLKEAKSLRPDEKDSIVGILSGGNYKELRIEAAREIIKEGISAMIISGIEELSDNSRQETLEALEEFKIKKIIRGGNPVVLLQSILYGVTEVIVNYPWKIVEEAIAVD